MELHPANLGLRKMRSKRVIWREQDIYGSTNFLSYVEDFVTLLREGEPLGVHHVYHDTDVLMKMEQSYPR
ncbi:MAG: hypothetical protein V8T12_01465 [Parabacteroides johnsonii]